MSNQVGLVPRINHTNAARACALLTRYTLCQAATHVESLFVTHRRITWYGVTVATLPPSYSFLGTGDQLVFALACILQHLPGPHEDSALPVDGSYRQLQDRLCSHGWVLGCPHDRLRANALAVPVCAVPNRRMLRALRIDRQENAIRALFPNAVEGPPGKLYRRLRILEEHCARMATAACNGTLTQERWELTSDKALGTLKMLLRPPRDTAGLLCINGDPRGYILKLRFRKTSRDFRLRNKWREAHGRTDWGGFGILAPMLKHPLE